MALLAAVLITGSTAQAATPRVLVVQFGSDVNPVTQGYLTSEIHRANSQHYDAVVIQMDTPGGLSESMRKIVKAELASKIPVIVYVSPDGSRAASAGVWIGQAADILAMAPQTNIGSSTPINLGGTNIQSDLRRKIVNDAAASLVALTAAHKRNAVWAAKAVRVASNLPARTALRENVIDVVAPTLPALLDKIDGRKTIPKGFVLHTKGAELTTVKMGLWKRLLNFLIDPNLISLMLSLGVLGLVVELWHPGLIFPATFGILCLAIAFFGLDVLPVNWAGLVLIAAAFAFWIAEMFVGYSHGALTLAGAACFIFGSLLLFQPRRFGLSGLAGGPGRDRRRVLALLRVRAGEGRGRPAAAGRGRAAHDRRLARARAGARPGRSAWRAVAGTRRRGRAARHRRRGRGARHGGPLARGAACWD